METTLKVRKTAELQKKRIANNDFINAMPLFKAIVVKSTVTFFHPFYIERGEKMRL